MNFFPLALIENGSQLDNEEICGYKKKEKKKE